MINEAQIKLVEQFYAALGAADWTTLRANIFAEDVVWRLPGRHPLAGIKRGITEVVAFLAKIRESGLQVEILKLDAIRGDRVVDYHRLRGQKGDVALDCTTATVYQIRGGKIAEVSDYLNDQLTADLYFDAAYALKPIPDRLGA